jgi:hypothetical protein
MTNLSNEIIQHYRAKTYRTLTGQRVSTQEEAVLFVNQRGFVFFWPIKDVTLPSLWVAVAGDREVADQHDDPGHITWGWKDSLLGSDQWYYAKILRKKATMIALDIVPYFYALSDNYGAPDEDYLTAYEQGLLTQEARNVYEALLKEGPLDTIALRRVTHMTSRSSDSRFNRALLTLQTDFKILPVGVARVGAWKYAHTYDIVARHYPEIPEDSRLINEKQARVKLIRLYLESVGAISLREITKLFRWKPRDVEEAVNELVQAEILKRGLEMKNSRGEWVGLHELVQSNFGH